MIPKAIDFTQKSKRFSSQSSLQGFKGYICSFFKNKPVQRMNEKTEEIHCITNKEKTTKNEWENDIPTFFKLYSMYIKN